MEEIGCSSNAHQNDSSRGLHDASKSNLTEKEDFVNHAEIAWNKMRKEWVGDQSKKLHRPSKDSTICLTASSDDMLFSREPFHPPIPLPAMVGYFVKIWEEQGLVEKANR
ncbi:uncharacterized protein LOC131612561 [Vicia villosa]|uniref:uncharacterized protein LOC131612561 n=1 Tax=Vicia villosa TaxID=3911 RepID=UPI00273C66DB|nr:uncharacterized protein LOC131612561 [Vicia villosa]XP_058740315.1 uncharacterized protein LOC131612561 [Vicia villosa]XP_058740316.1 uncharacterized protein LOC131612561 [Vicia villosa]XP_058740317.1 uncharacterized protein LOC131612561 [Vicia villosa]